MGKNKIYAIGKDDKAITLITLIVTIIVLLILAGVATFSGIEAINNTKYTKFKAELKIMQSHVNKWYEQLQPKEEETFEENIASKFNNVNATNANGNTEDATKAKNTLNTVGISNYSDYYLLKDTQKQQLKIEGVEQDVLVSVKDRKVVSYEGFTYKNNTYYTLDDLNEVYNVDYSQQIGQPDFKVKVENLSNGKARITVYDIEYEGYNNKWKVHYQKDGESTWKTSKDLAFFVEEDGIYTIKLANQDGDIQGTKTVSVSAFVIKDKNSTLDNSTDKTTMNSKNPVIPKGFRAVDTDTAKWKYTNEERTIVEGWNEGLVIEDDIGNQFVWVPCTMGTSQDVVTYSKEFSYPSNYSASELNTSDALDTTTVDGKTYSAIPVRENQQIFDYGGFYVARFEAGLPTETLEQSATLNNVYTQIPVSKYGAKVWNYIDYTHSYVAAEKMINNTSKYGKNKSGLITGTQWDTIMQWYEKNNIPVLENNQNWGTYKNYNYSFKGLSFTDNTSNIWKNNTASYIAYSSSYLYHGTGLNINGYKKNIADLGGNIWEWRTEASSSDINYRMISGGASHVRTLDYPSSSRYIFLKNKTAYSLGFRVVLYIQDEPQKEYVTDGLLAYYDAENNTGTGHSFTTTTWKDLSGNNNDATLYGFNNNAESGWHSNYLAFDGVDDFVSKTGITLDGANGTIEVIGKYIDGEYIFRSNASGMRTYIRYNITHKGDPPVGIYFNSNNLMNTSSRVLAWYTLNDKSYNLNYYNNSKSNIEEYTTTNNGDFISIGSFLAYQVDQPAKMEVYAVRVYNRALTEEEIRQNYEIDKVRFNIQD